MIKYWTLLSKQQDSFAPKGFYWVIEFGDYERATVAAEYDDYRAQGYKNADLKIIITDHAQAAIVEYVKGLNQ